MKFLVAKRHYMHSLKSKHKLQQVSFPHQNNDVFLACFYGRHKQFVVQLTSLTPASFDIHCHRLQRKTKQF